MQEGQGHGDACQGPRRLLRPGNVQHGWILCEAALRMWGREDSHVKDTYVSDSWGWQDLALMWVLMLTACTDNISHNFFLQGDCSPRWLPSQRPPPDMSQPASLFSLVIPAMTAFSNCEPNKPFLKLLWPPWLHLYLYLSRSGDNSRVLRYWDWSTEQEMSLGPQLFSHHLLCGYHKAQCLEIHTCVGRHWVHHHSPVKRQQNGDF